MKNIYEIIDYNSDFKEAYIQLNLKWLQEYGLLKDRDEQIIRNLEDEVFKKGGKIFLLVTHDFNLQGSIGLLPKSEQTVEIIKLSVDKMSTGKGYGKKLIQKAIDEAYKMDFTEIILYTNSILRPAISLYEKMGFQRVHLDDGAYEDSDIKMTLI